MVGQGVTNVVHTVLTPPGQTGHSTIVCVVNVVSDGFCVVVEQGITTVVHTVLTPPGQTGHSIIVWVVNVVIDGSATHVGHKVEVLLVHVGQAEAPGS